MKEIREMVSKVADLAEQKKIPFLCAFGQNKISVVEYSPDDTPERLVKARTTLVNTVKQARRSLDIEA